MTVDEIVQEHLQNARVGDAYSQWQLAKYYEEGKTTAKSNTLALYWYKKSASQDFVPAVSEMARLYAEGVLVEKDEKLSLYWSERAAALGRHSDMVITANYYFEIGEYKTAKYWIRKLARWGYSEMQYKLAHCFANGLGMDKDMVQAARWYARAAERGHKEAQKCLGDCYANGWGFEKNDERAEYWYAKAQASDKR